MPIPVPLPDNHVIDTFLLSFTVGKLVDVMKRAYPVGAYLVKGGDRVMIQGPPRLIHDTNFISVQVDDRIVWRYIIKTREIEEPYYEVAYPFDYKIHVSQLTLWESIISNPRPDRISLWRLLDGYIGLDSLKPGSFTYSRRIRTFRSDVIYARPWQRTLYSTERAHLEAIHSYPMDIISFVRKVQHKPATIISKPTIIRTVQETRKLLELIENY